MGHPPYSPGLASNDFALFAHIKKKMRDRFSSPEDTVGLLKTHFFGGVSIGVEKQSQVIVVH